MRSGAWWAAAVFDSRTLEQAGNAIWPGPPADATRLATSVHALRKKPLRELGPEDLRLLISQRVGLPWLVPRALDPLARNPLAAGDFDPGDLLTTTLRIERDHRLARSESAARLGAVVHDLDAMTPTSAPACCRARPRRRRR
ncbi:contact-dependent growth inhibition system immunity protein [Nocardia nova]|uniref:contact-dependent growth inhibition system immunity protein n=1 Tax=Nocardia nova TaxID=37330 RepID=UPI00340E45C5